MSDYGDAILTARDDGAVVVERADDVIGVSLELLARADLPPFADGLLVLDTAGEYRYRPLRFAARGVIVCERAT